uniref:Gldg family protein n=1 Tax=Desertifilum tharense IPPAS B-1220 TaxID=1781255 RepID=A0ACD5H0V5_9CYAN
MVCTILGVWLVYQISTLQRFWKQRSTEAGTNALIATLSVILILGLINFLGVRYLARFDLTETQIFTLAPQTQEILRNLDRPVKAFVFTSQANPTDRELLDSYQRIGGRNFSYEYIDPQLRPGLAQEFGVRSQTDIGNVYIEATPPETPEEEETVQPRRELVQNISRDRLAENRLTTTIERIASDRAFVVYFLQGHGQRPLEAD